MTMVDSSPTILDDVFGGPGPFHFESFTTEEVKTLALFAPRSGWASRYCLGRLIAERPGESTFEAIMLPTREKVALTLRAPGRTSTPVRRRVLETHQRLKHPNIVTIHDVGETDDGGLYLVSALPVGTSLWTYVTRKGALSPASVVRWARQLGEALRFAHNRGAVHGSLTPDIITIRPVPVERLELGGFGPLESRNDMVEDVRAFGRIVFFMLTGRWLAPDVEPDPTNIEQAVRRLEAHPRLKYIMHTVLRSALFAPWRHSSHWRAALNALKWLEDRLSAKPQSTEPELPAPPPMPPSPVTPPQPMPEPLYPPASLKPARGNYMRWALWVWSFVLGFMLALGFLQMA